MVWTNYILDILAGVFLFVTLLVCGKRGFIRCFFGIVTTMLALVLALTLSKAILSGTGGLFGLQDWLGGRFETFFAKLSGFNADISESGVEAALKEQNASAIVARLVMKAAGKQEEITAGTTLAMLLGQSTAGLAATLIVGILVYFGTKLLMRLLRGILESLANKMPLMKGTNTLLGTIFGFLYAMLIICAILAFAAILPIKSLPVYFEKTLFIGVLYEHNPLIAVLSWFL